jgi:RNA polymerase sigma-70 factor (ECF subfamily)
LDKDSFAAALFVPAGMSNLTPGRRYLVRPLSLMDPAQSSASSPPSDRDALYERFVALFVAHEGRLRAFVRALLPSWDDVDDVMQETSLVAWRKFVQFEPGSNFMAWAAAIARFEAMRVMRTRSRERAMLADDVLDLLASDAVAVADNLERERAALTRCVQKLRPPEQQLLRLAYQPGVRFNEVASQVGKSVQACYKTIQRLRSRLAECVAQQLQEESV